MPNFVARASPLVIVDEGDRDSDQKDKPAS
jgi:hypothetical protein